MLLLEKEKMLDYQSQLHDDLRIEVLLADLLENGISWNDIYVHSTGIFSRKYSKDVERIEWEEDEEIDYKKLHLYTFREGFYHLLPETFIHQPSQRASANNIEATLKEMQLQREKAKEATLFFLPFEQEIYRLKTEVEVNERSVYEYDTQHQGLAILNYIFWDLPNYISDKQRIVLYHLFPLLYRIVGNIDWVQKTFQLCLGVEVSLKKGKPINYFQDANKLKPMTEMFLGVDMLLGNTFSDGIPIYEVHIGPIPKAQIPHFLPGGNLRKFTDYLCGCLLPVEMEVQIILRPNYDEVQGCQLGTDYLGFSGSI